MLPVGSWRVLGSGGPASRLKRERDDLRQGRLLGYRRVGPCLRGDLHDVVPGAEKDHGRLGVVKPEDFYQLRAVSVGEHEVEDGEAEASVVADELPALLDGAGADELGSFNPAQDQRLREGRVVLHDHHALHRDTCTPTNPMIEPTGVTLYEAAPKRLV